MTTTQTTRTTTPQRPATLGRTLARSLTTGLTVFGFGAGLTLYITAWPKAERGDAVADLLTFGFLAALLWGAWRARNLTEQQALRVALVLVALFVLVGIYAVAAVLGILPAAPWSSLG